MTVIQAWGTAAAALFASLATMVGAYFVTRRKKLEYESKTEERLFGRIDSLEQTFAERDRLHQQERERLLESERKLLEKVLELSMEVTRAQSRILTLEGQARLDASHIASLQMQNDAMSRRELALSRELADTQKAIALLRD